MKTQILELTDDVCLPILQELKHDIYHLPEYINLESKRTNAIPEAMLISDNEKKIFVPYLLRSLNVLFNDKLSTSKEFDIISPYGYPGILLSKAALDSPEFLSLAIEQLKSVLIAKNVYSAFLRLHPILNHGLNEILSSQICQVTGETVSVDLTLSEAEIWQHTRAEHRNHINRCKRNGFIAKIVNLEDYIDEFMIIYNQTMDRVEAKKYYYFDREYYTSLAKLNKNIHLCIVELDNQVVAAGILTVCCGIVQYHLSGTKTEFLKQAPSKLMINHISLWAKKCGNKIFHLGGGLGSAKDSLYNFKAGFSKQRHKFLTLRLITDESKYHSLVELQAKSLNIQKEELLNSSFFPAYRYSLSR